MSKGIPTDIAREYRSRYGWDMPSLKLARIMYKECPTAFNDVEHARQFLRRIEDKMGKNNTNIKRTDIPERPRNPYNLPESDKVDREPFILPTACNNILLISDLHIPYHDVKAIELAFEYGQKHKVNTIFINGDLLDFHRLSKFMIDPRKRSVKHEFDTAKAFIRSLRAAFPDALIYWLKGNHDMRYEHWLMTKAYEIFDDEYYHMENRLRLNEERIHIIDDKTLVKMGKLAVTHGHHIMRGFFSPVNSARGAWLKAKQSVLISHVHKVSSHTESNLEHGYFGTWSTGCLCELKPDYSPMVSNYQHGFAHIMVDSSGDFTVENKPILNYKVH